MRMDLHLPMNGLDPSQKLRFHKGEKTSLLDPPVFLFLPLTSQLSPLQAFPPFALAGLRFEIWYWYGNDNGYREATENLYFYLLSIPSVDLRYCSGYHAFCFPSRSRSSCIQPHMCHRLSFRVFSTVLLHLTRRSTNDPLLDHDQLTPGFGSVWYSIETHRRWL
ncbi:uncharacterized protein BJX67DRAFT_207225 [Aspergillus lucknowensis]|uniref:Uncharacterized protein n=1 Tax=Aspergillus lucknowensis TaxID=176173 RepID=A0ABR4LJ71_9EURO